MRGLPHMVGRVLILSAPVSILFGFSLKPALTFTLILLALAIVFVPFIGTRSKPIVRYGLWGVAGTVGLALVLTDVMGGTTDVHPTAPVVVKQLPSTTGTILWAQNNVISGVVPSTGAQKTVATLADGSIVSDAALSPDGGRYAIAFAPEANGVSAVDDLLKLMDLYIMPASGHEPKLLLNHTQAGGGISHPAWSTDGQYVFVVVKNDQTSATSIVRVTTADGTVAKIANFAGEPSCAPDGKTLVFVHIQASDGYAEVWRSNLDGSDAKAIKGSRFQNVVSPVVSPDGKTLAFSAPYIPTQKSSFAPRIPFFSPSVASAHGGNWEVYTLPLKGGTAEVRSAFAENQPRLVWSPTGDEIAVNADLGLYVIDLKQNRTNLFEVNIGNGLVWTR
ncbi:MAG: hypothetical protein WBW04_00845 [Nitrolancea sp.]